MVWKKSDGTVVNLGSSWVDANKIRHPSNWGVWTDVEKKAAGLTWTDDPQPHDERFYSGRDANGKLIEKSLVDVDAVDSDGNKIKDTEGNQVVYEGLKTKWIRETKEMANGFLKPTDWYVTRKAETDTAIPSSITTYRGKIRTASKTIEDKINACSSLNDFMALFNVPSDGSNQPIYDFPKED